jgi:hypothetical protein
MPLLKEEDPERFASQLAFARETIALAHEFVKTPAKGHRVGISSMFVARAAQALESCCILGERGAAGDSMSVGRTVVELDIEHAYVLVDDESVHWERWESYVAEEAVSRKKLVAGMVALQAGDVDQAELDRALEKAQQRADQMAHLAKKRGTIESRAKASGREHQYGCAYRDMCGASHGGFMTLWYVTEPTDRLPFPILIGFGPPTSKAVVIATVSMMMLLRTAIGNPPAEGFSALNERLEKTAARWRATYEASDAEGAG